MVNNYKFSIYKNSHKAQVINLLRSEWSYSDEVFNWKFKQNPYTNKVRGYVVLDGEEVVGFRGFIPLKFKFNEEIIEVLSLTDGFISRKHRRKKLFTLFDRKIQN